MSPGVLLEVKRQRIAFVFSLPTYLLLMSFDTNRLLWDILEARNARVAVRQLVVAEANLGDVNFSVRV